MISTRKRLFSSVHRAFAIENIPYIAALVPGMAKENSKMSCAFFNETHSLDTNSNISDHLSKVVKGLYSTHPFWFYLNLQYEQIHTTCNTAPILQKYVAWRQGPRHLLQWIHILFDHTKTFPRAIFLSLRICNMFTLIGYSFFGKIRRYFLLQLSVSAAIACILFLICCSISKRRPCSIENCDLQMEHSTLPTC
jgi:hypothetical protein